MSSQPLKLVYFYAVQDRDLVEQMKPTLSFLQTRGYIKIWCKDNIIAGDIMEQTVNAVKDAKIVLYFFSDDFIVTEYNNLEKAIEIEGEPAKAWIYKKNKTEQLLLIPILLYDIAGITSYDENNLFVPPVARLGCIEKPARKNAFAKIGDNIIEYVKKSRGESVEIPLPARRKPPVLESSKLPYLCARSDQTRELQRVFDEYLNAVSSNAPKRPLVCVIHGQQEECPEGYQERFEKRDIYEFLRMDYEQPPQRYYLSFPHQSYDVAEPLAFFERTLKEEFSDGEVVELNNPSSVLDQFRTVIISYDVQKWNRGVMQSFFDFWNTSPVQNTRATVIVNLIFSYDETSGFYKESNLEARNFFSELKNQRLANYPNMSIAVTPELDAVAKTEVIDWLDSTKVFRDFCPQHNPNFCDRMTVRQQINNLYSHPKTPWRVEREIKIEVDGRVEPRKEYLIRMQTLSKKLGKLLVDVRKSSHS